MKFVCDRCQTKYSIPDERVRGKVLKVKCKTCANLITVREARSPSVAGMATLSAAVGSAAAARPRSGVHPPIDTIENEERTQLAQAPVFPDADAFPDLGAFAPAPPVAKRRPTGPLAADDHVQWYMALDGNRTGPFTRQKLVDRLIPLAKSADVHIWNERLGSWKPPSDVPEIGSEITRRRAPPPPPPGAPRRPTPPPIPPLANLGQLGQPGRKPTGPHAPPSPIGHGPPGGASKLPPPGGVHPALAARGAHEASGDPSSLLETPAPMPHQLPHPKTNGVGGSKGHAPPHPANSDVMQMLNMPGASQSIPGAPPKLISVASTIAMGGGTVEPRTRSKSGIYILGLLAVVGVVVVLVTLSTKKPKAVAVPPPVVTTVVPEKVVEPPPPPPPEPVIEPTQPPPPLHGKPIKGRPQKAPRGGGKTPTSGPAPNPGNGDANRFQDTHEIKVAPTGPSVRPPPAQGDIMKVISNNRANIKVCYQRALTRDNSLTHGKLAVKLSIGISGRVKHVNLDGPSQFKILLEPCIKEVVARWVFPQASEEYGTEFPLVFQGNE